MEKDSPGMRPLFLIQKMAENEREKKVSSTDRGEGLESLAELRVAFVVRSRISKQNKNGKITRKRLLLLSAAHE
jgi:hypothetical protein